MKLWVDQMESALGTLMIVTDDQCLRALDYKEHSDRMMTLLQRRYGTVELVPQTNPLDIRSKLSDYFAGDYATLETIPVNPGGTAFQRQVWQILRTIPCSQTWTYGQLAAAMGKPTASRAVGLANSKNPIAIVIPCHRVIGANMTLTGYAGGLERKRWLLKHERVLPLHPLSTHHPSNHQASSLQSPFSQSSLATSTQLSLW